MSIKLDERGRGKFRPNKEYTNTEVQAVLTELRQDELSKSLFSEDNVRTKSENPTIPKTKIETVSLFCGVGGLDLGFELACLDAQYGLDLVSSALTEASRFSELRSKGRVSHLYANDFFKEALVVYSNRMSCRCVENKDIRQVKTFPSNADVILGGFPCPGFSLGGPRLIDDPRNFLYLHFVRALKQVKPKFFIAENVKGMLTLGNGEVFKQIKQDFESVGYKVFHKLVNAADYGVPQHRHRVFLVGVRHDLVESVGWEHPSDLFPCETHGEGLFRKPYRTLRDAISDLENSPGRFYEGSFSPMYMSRNRKKSWEEPSFTIQASGRQAPLHPAGAPMVKLEADKWTFADPNSERRLSVKEIARIQTFPDWWFEDLTEKHSNAEVDKVYKQVGNAVPVELARVLTRSIAEFLLNK